MSFDKSKLIFGFVSCQKGIFGVKLLMVFFSEKLISFKFSWMRRLKGFIIFLLFEIFFEISVGV